MQVKILFIGDIVGDPGVRAVRNLLPGICQEQGIDFVIANGENAYNGSGLTPDLAEQLLSYGVNAITLGDHCWRRAEIAKLMKKRQDILRPANYPDEGSGIGHTVIRLDSLPPIAVIDIVGRVFMHPVDCPFHAADAALDAIGDAARIIIVDMHAEATSEKQALGRYLDGRVSAAIGTHTHVPTADERILPGGTAFICDIGMTGPHESIIGRRIEPVIRKLTTQMPSAFNVAAGDIRLNGAILTVDSETGHAGSIQRLAVELES